MTMTRRTALAAVCALMLCSTAPTLASTYPSRPIELIVPVAAGGGTDIVGRAFANTAKNHLPQQSMIVLNKPGASGAIGTAELINASPDGYKIGIIICELTIIPHLGVTKHTASDLRPIAQLNADPSAITVRADAPWQTIEEFLDDARTRKEPVAIANAGVGSIWHMAAAAFANETDINVNHVPYLGAAPAVIGLLGGHVDAIAVSPGEVAQHVAAGKMRTLAVMADERVGGVFSEVPTLKERNIDLSVGVWRGLAVPKTTPEDVVRVLSDVAQKTANDPAFKDTLAKANLGWAFADAQAFQAVIDRDREFYATLVPRLDLQQ